MFNLQTGELAAAAAAARRSLARFFSINYFPQLYDDDDNGEGNIGDYGKGFDGDVDCMKLFVLRFLATMTVQPFRAIDVVLQVFNKILHEELG